MKSLSKGSVLKSGWVYMNPSETRVIDTNAMVESRLKELAIKLAAETDGDAGFTDGFVQGINAEQVASLIEEDDEAQEEQISESEAMLEQAKQDIESMRTQALAEIEEARVRIIEEAKTAGYEEGFAQGKKEGYDQGHQDGWNSVAEEREKAKQEAALLREQLDNEYQKKIDELEPQFIETLTGIYEHIFHVSLKNQRDLVVYLIANTLRNLEGGSGYLIHVSKEDYPFVNMQKKELIEGTGILLDDIEVLEDATLGRSECMIETGNGVFDCSLGTQLEALNEELKLLSYGQGKTEG